MKRHSFLTLLAGSVLVLAIGGIAWHFAEPSATAETAPAVPAGVPVVAGVAREQDVPICLTGLGTVQAFNTVTVHTRVDGELDKELRRGPLKVIAYRENDQATAIGVTHA